MTAEPRRGSAFDSGGPRPPASWPAACFGRPLRAWRPRLAEVHPHGAAALALERGDGGTTRSAPATVAALLAVASRAHPPPWLDRQAAGGPGASPIDLELLAPRPIHHVLEFAGLYGLLEGLRSAAPSLRVRLWLRSALEDEAPFHRLPACKVVRLPAAAGAPGDAAVASLRQGGGACVLLGRDAAWESRLDDDLPDWLRGQLPRELQWRLPDGKDAAAAAAAFFDAVAAASPRWLETPPAAPDAAAPREISRVVVYQARSHVGDTLWLTPLLRAVRRRFPGAMITVVLAEGAAPVLATNPHLGEVLRLAPDASPSDRETLRRDLERRHFDAALFAFARRPQARWLAQAAADLGIPWRINLECFDGAEDGREPSPLFTHEGWFFWGTLPSPRLLLHALDPLPSSFGTGGGGEGRAGSSPGGGGGHDRHLELPLDPAWRQQADQVLSATGIGYRPFALLAPAARSSARWPARKFAALALRLADELGLHVLIEGGATAGDAAVLAEVDLWLRQLAGSKGGGQRSPVARLLPFDPEAAAPRARPGPEPAVHPRPAVETERRIAVRQDSLGTLAALLARAHLLVANDSAPIHLAEVTATPTLYFAHHEKLIHSHPAAERCRALYDAARNRPARIPVGAAFAAIAEMVREGLVPDLAAAPPRQTDGLVRPAPGPDLA